VKTKTRDAVNAFIERNKHALLLLYFMIYLPWFGHLERTVTTHFHVIHVALDDYIPFCEYFIASNTCTASNGKSFLFGNIKL